MHKRKLHIKSVLNLLLGKVGIVSLLILVQIAVLVVFILRLRSEERRVGKEC